MTQSKEAFPFFPSSEQDFEEWSNKPAASCRSKRKKNGVPDHHHHHLRCSMLPPLPLPEQNYEEYTIPHRSVGLEGRGPTVLLPGGTRSPHPFCVYFFNVPHISTMLTRALYVFCLCSSSRHTTLDFLKGKGGGSCPLLYYLIALLVLLHDHREGKKHQGLKTEPFLVAKRVKLSLLLRYRGAQSKTYKRQEKNYKSPGFLLWSWM